VRPPSSSVDAEKFGFAAKLECLLLRQKLGVRSRKVTSLNYFNSG
jgi:hypothetical protein